MTLLPNKHIPLRSSPLGVGAYLLEKLDRPASISGLWDRCRQSNDVATFERFIVALDLLFVLGALRLEDSLLVRVQ
jgi:hypothetical protein